MTQEPAGSRRYCRTPEAHVQPRHPGVLPTPRGRRKTCLRQADLRYKWLGLEVGEFGFFGDIGEGFEVEMVAVGVGEGYVPHVVANEGFFGVEVARTKLVVEGEGVVALEPDGDASAEFFRGNAAWIVFLEHEGGGA